MNAVTPVATYNPSWWDTRNRQRQGAKTRRELFPGKSIDFLLTGVKSTPAPRPAKNAPLPHKAQLVLNRLAKKEWAVVKVGNAYRYTRSGLDVKPNELGGKIKGSVFNILLEKGILKQNHKAQWVLA